MKVKFSSALESKGTKPDDPEDPEIKKAKKFLKELSKFKVSNNCQKFAAALELKYRGVNKKVTPTSSPFDRVFDVPRGSKSPHAMWHLFRKIDPVVIPGKDCVNKIESTMKKWGNGARAIISTTWESGSGHVFNLINIKGEIYLMDATAERIKLVSKSDYLKNKTKQAILVRSDTGTPDEYLIDATFEKCTDKFHLDFEKGGTIRSPSTHSILGFLRLIAHKEGEVFVVNWYDPARGDTYEKIGKVRTLGINRTYSDGEFKYVAWDYEWL